MKKDQRLIIKECLDLMWDIFNKVAKNNHPTQVHKFILIKEYAHKALAFDVKKRQ
jgi:hypothetical protein